MNKELLFSVTAKDCDWTYYRASGNGGQNRNKRETACRCVHKASGAVGIGEDHREQRRNREAAFERMAKSLKFQLWLKREIADSIKSEEQKDRERKAIEEEVNKMMQPENLKIETFQNGKWIEFYEDADNEM